MCSLGRFDLHETGYVLPVMCDITPAWREAYTRIADELVTRHTSFHAAIDWLTMIGNDPDQRRYPPEWLAVLPEHLRGRYDAPGWVALLGCLVVTVGLRALALWRNWQLPAWRA